MHRGAADHARRGRGDDRRLGRVPARPRPPGARRHGALLRRLQGRTPSSRSGRSRRPSSRAPPTSCCATPTAARCRTRSGDIVADVHAHVGDDAIIGIHCHDDTGCAVANSMAAVARRCPPRAGHAQRSRRAHRQRQPDLDHPQPPAQAGLRRACPRGGSSASPSCRHRVAETLNRAVNPQAPYVGSSAFAHKAGLHVSRDRARQGRLRARRSRAGRQRHALRRVGDGGPGDDPDEGRRARPRDGRRRRSTR